MVSRMHTISQFDSFDRCRLKLIKFTFISSYIIHYNTDAERNAMVVHNPHGCQVMLYDHLGRNGTIKSPGYPIAYVPYVAFSNSI